MNWIIAANSNLYDLSSSFEHFGFIDWKQGKIKYELGDTVYIYCSKPLQMLQYKCRVEKMDLNSNQIRDDKEYWLNEEEYYKSLNGKFMRLNLIEQVSNNKMKLDQLIQNGFKSAPQGPVKIKDQRLLKYIEKFFTDSYQSDFFPEVLNEEQTEYEGAKRTIVVNKYERSSKARENAVKFHGFKCKVCGISFEETYGLIGKGFIHIHHLVP